MLLIKDLFSDLKEALEIENLPLVKFCSIITLAHYLCTLNGDQDKNLPAKSCYLMMSSIKDDICKPASIFIFPALCKVKSLGAIQPEAVIIRGCKHNINIWQTSDKCNSSIMKLPKACLWIPHLACWSSSCPFHSRSKSVTIYESGLRDVIMGCNVMTNMSKATRPS